MKGTLLVPLAAALVLLAACGNDASTDAGAPRAVVTVTATATVEVPGPTVTVQAQPPAKRRSVKPKSAKPKLPTAVPGDGTFLVGTDVAAGTYRNAGGAIAGAPCVANTTRQPQDLTTFIRGSASKGPAVITVNKGEWFNTAHCKPFHRE